MNYKILDIDPLAMTILIEWEDGIILNHAIPVNYLAVKLGGKLIKNREGALEAIDEIIKRERM